MVIEVFFKHLFFKYDYITKDVTGINDIIGIEMIVDVKRMEIEKQKLIEENEFREALLLLEAKRCEFRQNEKYKHDFRANILRCVKKENEVFCGFVSHNEEFIRGIDYPLNYDYRSCTKFAKLKAYLKKKDIQLKNKAPIKTYRLPSDILIGVYIRYDSKNKILCISEESMVQF